LGKKKKLFYVNYQVPKSSDEIMKLRIIDENRGEVKFETLLLRFAFLGFFFFFHYKVILEFAG
jgi:hypothetical protein